MQDSSCIQQNQDKSPKITEERQMFPIHINSIHFNENSRSRSCKKGITLARGSVLWSTLDDWLVRPSSDHKANRKASSNVFNKWNIFHQLPKCNVESKEC